MPEKISQASHRDATPLLDFLKEWKILGFPRSKWWFRNEISPFENVLETAIDFAISIIFEEPMGGINDLSRPCGDVGGWGGQTCSEKCTRALPPAA